HDTRVPHSFPTRRSSDLRDQANLAFQVALHGIPPSWLAVSRLLGRTGIAGSSHRTRNGKPGYDINQAPGFSIKALSVCKKRAAGDRKGTRLNSSHVSALY